MPNVALTGANGFLGWHVRCAAFAFGINTEAITLGELFSQTLAVQSLEQADSVIHIAGVNRGSDTEVHEGNLEFSKQLSEALAECKNPPRTVYFTNSTQISNGTVYGDAKKQASEILRKTCDELGLSFIDVLIPNVFGEHGRPFYNSVTATFCHLIANNEIPKIILNKELTMVHAQDVADYLLGQASTKKFESTFQLIEVAQLRDEVVDLSEHYLSGEIPDISNYFTKNLLNTYRSYLSTERIAFEHNRHEDDRGSFFEIIKVLGGEGQTSFSTTVPGISRGDHFHRRKIERFTVLSGEATISMRKMFTNEVISFKVSGDEPTSIDMPTLWTHNISNNGTTTLFTSFWINEVFDPTAPDTFLEKVKK